MTLVMSVAIRESCFQLVLSFPMLYSSGLGLAADFHGWDFKVPIISLNGFVHTMV